MRGKEFDRIVADHIKQWTPKDGVNIIRILPPTWPKPTHFGVDIYAHYRIGPDNQTYLDLSKMQDKPDPIAEERAEALRSGDEEYAKELESKRRCGVYIIDRDNEKEGVQFWAMPWTIDADLNKLCVDKRNGEVLNIDDPEEGYDIEFEKTGKGISTKYQGLAIARRSSPLGSNKWLDFAVENPIPDQLVYFDYDHIAKAFGGGGSNKGRSSDREERDERNDDRGSNSRRSFREDRDEGREGGRSSSGRGSDRAVSSRGSRGADNESDQENDERGMRRNREEDSRSRRESRRDEPVHTWESIHDMTIEELESLCESEEALQDVNPAKADGRADLADWICEELKIKKSASGGGRRKIESSDDDDTAAKLRRMREERSR
jgi:hypothetical protein